MYPVDDPHSLVLTDLLGLWADRAERIREQRKATQTFRRALISAVDTDQVPILHVAKALGISSRGVRRHLEAARSVSDSS